MQGCPNSQARQEGQHFQNVSSKLICTGPCLKANPSHTLAACILHRYQRLGVYPENIPRASAHLDVEVANLKKPNSAAIFASSLIAGTFWYHL